MHEFLEYKRFKKEPLNIELLITTHCPRGKSEIDFLEVRRIFHVLLHQIQDRLIPKQFYTEISVFHILYLGTSFS